jgi:carbon storage regulator CsrA
MALLLTRKIGESVTLTHAGIAIRVTVKAIRGSQARLAFDAPQVVEIFRNELSKREPDETKSQG